MTPPLVIVADPPWRFRDTLPGKGRGAAKNYRTMSMPELLRMDPAPISEIDRAVLFLWRAASMQQEALTLAEGWGFVVKSELVWIKTTSKGKRHFGMGHYVRAEHETCLIATRGKGCGPVVRNVRSAFSAPVREHSRKPDAFYGIVERLYPASRKIELFARDVRPGWEQHGDELGCFEGVA